MHIVEGLSRCCWEDRREQRELPHSPVCNSTVQYVIKRGNVLLLYSASDQHIRKHTILELVRVAQMHVV